MGLFSGLEALGFKNENMQVYETKAEEKTETVQKEQTMPTVKEEECLFPKTHECPVCYEKFKSLAVRAGKLHSVGQEDDLRPLYNGMDPLKYDAIVCPHCGYAALSRYFSNMMPHQAKTLRAEVKAKFKGMNVSEKLYDYDEAILHYKMVLMCDVIGGVKNSRRAYTCLKLAWIMRGKLEQEASKLTTEERDKLQSDELECIQNAYNGYTKALSSETFPMSGMDEPTVCYLVADLAYRLEKYRESLLLISQIVTRKDLSPRIKDKALELKEKIRQQVKGESN